MKIAVTGASGFIGTALGGALSSSGYDWLPLDLRASLPPLAGVDAVVHLAAIAHTRGTKAEELQRVNVDLAARVGDAAAAAGARMIFVSSVKVHGEETRAPLVESSPISPQDPYAESKAKAEQALRRIAGLRLTVLRPPLAYGPGVKANFLALLKAISRGMPLPLASIENRRSLVYVGNLAHAVMACIDKPETVNRTYLVSDGSPVSTPQLCRLIGDALGRPPRLFRCNIRLLELFPGVKRLTRSLEVDDTAFRRDLRWKPPFRVEEGFRGTARWYVGR